MSVIVIRGESHDVITDLFNLFRPVEMTLQMYLPLGRFVDMDPNVWKADGDKNETPAERF